MSLSIVIFLDFFSTWIGCDDFEKIAEGRNEQLIASVAGFLRTLRWKKGIRL
jgi:hypothetical protein